MDFILNEDTAIEVKETPIEQYQSLLNQRVASLNIGKQFLIGRYPSTNKFEDFIWGGSIF